MKTEEHSDGTTDSLRFYGQIVVKQDVATKAMLIDMNGNSQALQIDQDNNSASDIAAIQISCDNAGAGDPIGIDLSSFSADEALFKVPADAISTAGSVAHQIPIDVGGTIYYLVAYSHGS